ncbi:MAG: DUF3160 domain-containing protein [Chloroflexota bacterium]
MKLNRLTLWLVLTALVFTSACRPAVPSPSTPAASSTTSPASTSKPTTPTPTELEKPRLTQPAAPTPLAGLQPFPPGDALLAAPPALQAWQPGGDYAGLDYTLPVDIAQVYNPQVVSALTPAQQAYLADNGFVVIHSQEEQFNDIRENVPIRYGQPYYLTTDAAYHALHISFDEMLKALEAQYLSGEMSRLIQATLDEVLAYQSQAQGTAIQADARLAAAYLAVAVKLFNPQAELPPDLEPLVQPQLAQVMAASGRAPSVLIPAFEDDYGAYKPVGHYAGPAVLENYFRGMTWLGRVHFLLGKGKEGQPPSRAPLIVTLALRRAQVGDRSAAQAWAGVHAMLTFVVGPSDDPGPPEYAALMDQVYGRSLEFAELADEARWQQFLQSGDQLPAPQINSTFVDFLRQLDTQKGWRFMGQRFTPDGLIFQQLIYDAVGTYENRRHFPLGLDIFAVLGSPLALDLLDEAGETQYAHYPEQMEKLRQSAQAQPAAQWLDTFYTSWLYAFFAQVEPKNTRFPAYMRSTNWGYKELNSALGSWAELKHDTALYAKMPEAAGGGGPPMSGPAPAYVEPLPDVFYRLGCAAKTLSTYLQSLMDRPDVHFGPPPPGDYLYDGLYGHVRGLDELGDRFTQLGDLAAREIAGQPLSPDDYDLIQGCMGAVECFVFRGHTPYGENVLELPDVPVIAAVSGSEQEVLEVAVGKVDRIYVVVPLEGRLQIAQGGVFSYYELIQPRSDRLTDEQWRARLAGSPPPQPGWISRFVLAGGEPVDYLAFRVDDAYRVTEAGDKLNVRNGPGLSYPVLTQLAAGDYVTIVEGPVVADGYTWWRVQLSWGEWQSGWVVENQEWYRRSTIFLE